MKRNEYTLYSSKIKSDKNIAIVSDLHISENTSDKKLNEVLSTLEDIEPTQIVMPGDLYNVDMTTLCDDKVTNFMNSVKEIADVFYVKGHTEDLGSLQNYRLLPKRLNQDGRIHVLGENKGGFQTIATDYADLTITGLRFPTEFYQLSELEKLNTLLSKCEEYLHRIIKLSDNSYNILLCHEPIIRDVIYLLEVMRDDKPLSFDLVISGHNHGGILPEKLRPLFRAISQDFYKYYPSYVKGITGCGENGSIIISEGITKYHSEMGILENLERFHEGTIENVRILKKD